jgi:hypothetical protein
LFDYVKGNNPVILDETLYLTHRPTQPPLQQQILLFLVLQLTPNVFYVRLELLDLFLAERFQSLLVA